MFQGEVVQIVISPSKGKSTENRDAVEVKAGLGIIGDRYENFRGKSSVKKGLPNTVTFIEIETFEAIARDYKTPLDPLEARRNVVTRGVPLNHLVGKEFLVGKARYRGVELAEPCAYLENMLDKPVLKLLRHRGGLRAEALDGGSIEVGMVVKSVEKEFFEEALDKHEDFFLSKLSKKRP